MIVDTLSPARLPDLLPGAPLVVTGRYAGRLEQVTIAGRTRLSDTCASASVPVSALARTRSQGCSTEGGQPHGSGHCRHRLGVRQDNVACAVRTHSQPIEAGGDGAQVSVLHINRAGSGTTQEDR